MANTNLPPKEYWIKRSEQNLLIQEKKAEDYINSLLKSYKKVKDNIDKEVSVFYMRYAVNNSISYIDVQRLLNKSEIDKFHDRLDTYIKEARLYSSDPLYIKQLENMSIRTRIRRIETLKLDIQHQIEILESVNTNDIDELLTGIYTDNYYRSIYDIQAGLEFGTAFNIVNIKAVEKIVREKWLGENYSDRIYADKAKLLRTIEVELSQSFIRGDSIQNTSKRIYKRLDINYNSALRLIRTESNHISNESFADSMINSGIVSEYEFCATLDSRTSDLCANMDNQHFKWNEKQVGINFPPLHSNCRSTIIPYFKDEDTPERIAKDANGKTYYVDGNMSYKQWKEKYVDNSINSDIIKSGANSGALNPDSKEAFKHAKTYYESVRKMNNDCNEIADKTGFSVDYINTAKQHLFLTKHNLGNGKLEYFYPDYEIAQSWQRLMDNKMQIQDHDLILLHHEYLESKYMKNGMLQSEAHREAEKVYNYAKALKERG